MQQLFYHLNPVFCFHYSYLKIQLTFRIDLAALSRRLCKKGWKTQKSRLAAKPIGSMYPIYIQFLFLRKQFAYFLCIPFIRKQHCHNPKSIVQPCDICVGGIFNILLIPTLKQAVTDISLFLRQIQLKVL